MYSVDVIIPSYKPDQKLRKLLELLLRQSYPIQNIIIINTEKSLLDPALIPEDARISGRISSITARAGTSACRSRMQSFFS